MPYFEIYVFSYAHSTKEISGLPRKCFLVLSLQPSGGHGLWFQSLIVNVNVNENVYVNVNVKCKM